MKYQLEKLEKVNQLMSILGIHDEQFVDQIKSRILMSNIQNISVQKNTSSFETAIFWRIVCKQRDGYFDKKILLLSILLLDSYLIIECIVQCFFLKKYRF